MTKEKKLWMFLAATLLVACGVQSAPTVQPTQVSATQIATDEAVPTLEPMNVTIGVQPFASNLPLYIAQQEGYFAEQGFEVQLVPIASLSELTTAFILGEVHVTGSVLTSSQFVGIRETPGFRFVADKGYLDPSGCPYSAWVVRNELIESGELNDLRVLADLTIASTRSSLQSLWALDVLLEPVGLTVNDLEIVEIPQENRVEAFRNGAIDMGGLAEPLVTRALKEGVAQIWMGYEEIQPDLQLATLWYGPLFTEENREAGKRFMIAYLKAVRQYNEGKTEQNIELMAEFTQLDPQEVRSMCWQAFRSDGSLNFESILEFQEWLVANDYLDSVVPVEEFWDGEFIENAIEMLGN